MVARCDCVRARQRGYYSLVHAESPNALRTPGRAQCPSA